MNGKKLKISNNDLYGNVDDRKVAVFAVFNHLKYMNKYVIFTYDNEFDKKKLYYGSVHLKDNSLVIFSVNATTKKYIDDFINGYLSGNINPSEFEIIGINDIQKVELVSFNDIDFDRLDELDRLSIKRILPENNEDSVKKKYSFLYVLLIIMFLLLGGITYLYLYPEKFTTEFKQLSCMREIYDEKVLLNYENSKIIKFDKNDRVKSINNTDTYIFSSQEDYVDFKNNHKENNLLNGNREYKYDDEKLNLKLFYIEELIVEDYDEVMEYMKRDGYQCQEGKYYE